MVEGERDLSDVVLDKEFGASIGTVEEAWGSDVAEVADETAA